MNSQRHCLHHVTNRGTQLPARGASDAPRFFSPSRPCHTICRIYSRTDGIFPPSNIPDGCEMPHCRWLGIRLPHHSRQCRHSSLKYAAPGRFPPAQYRACGQCQALSYLPSHRQKPLPPSRRPPCFKDARVGIPGNLPIHFRHNIRIFFQCVF